MSTSTDDVQLLLQSKIQQLEFEDVKENNTGENRKRPLGTTSALSKTQSTQLRQVMDKTKGNMEERAVLLREMYIHEASRANHAERKLLASEIKAEKSTKELQQTSLVKSKLEDLCRELRKEVKIVTLERQKSVEEEMKKRQELSENFNSTINDVMEKLKTQDEEHQKQEKEKNELKEKLQQFLEHCEARDKHYETQLQAKSLEAQLVEAKAKQREAIVNDSLAKAHELITVLEEKNKAYKEKAEADAAKFVSIEQTLKQSVGTFEMYREEIDKLTKFSKKLEKENHDLVKKTRSTDIVLIQQQEERNNLAKELAGKTSQLEKMMQLCRSLQEERRQLLGKVEGGREGEASAVAVE